MEEEEEEGEDGEDGEECIHPEVSRTRAWTNHVEASLLEASMGMAC